MGMQVGGGKGGAMKDPNVVPLIDVLLVLIIIFMAITPTIPVGLNAQIPQPAPPNQKQNQQQQEKTIVVSVASDGSLKINQSSVTWAQLGPQLQTIFKERAPDDRIAFIQGAKKVEYAYVARAIDIMNGVPSLKVGLMPTQIGQGQ
jgi:biopolymer transport protein ExbD